MSKNGFNRLLASLLLYFFFECLTAMESNPHQLHRYYYDDTYYYNQPRKNTSGVGIIAALIVSLICGLICFFGVRYYCNRRR
jgi:hypothetical protein